jgi:alanine dehydrogenase
METLLLDSDQVESLASMETIVASVEAAFAAYANGNAAMPAKSYVDLPQYDGDFRSMPAYLETDSVSAAGVKWVNVHPNNPDRHDLPTVMGTMIYSDPSTGFPRAIIDGTELTRLRTAAAAAVATDYLAIEQASSMGVVGAGRQSIAQVEAISTVRPIESIVVSDPDEAARSVFQDAVGDEYTVESGTPSEAGDCDVVSTVTPVRDPILARGDVADHAHVNAIGADAKGKQELEGEILTDATLVIDDMEQCTHSGEINVPWEQGKVDEGDITGTIPDLVTGTLAGAVSQEQLSVFDSTGLALQDVAAAHAIYERATEAGAGTTIDLLSLADA